MTYEFVMKCLPIIFLLVPLIATSQPSSTFKTNETTINGWTSVDISVDSFQLADSFEVIWAPDSANVSSFQLVIDPKKGNGDPKVVRIMGSLVKEPFDQWLKDLKPGDRLIMDMIRVINDSGARALSPIVYRITD